MSPLGAIRDRIRVGSQDLSGVVEGDIFRVTRLSGWWERPGVKREALPRGRSDGDYDMPWYMEPRYIQIDGTVDACSHDRVHTLMDRLSGLAAYRKEEFSVSGHGSTRSTEIEADDTAYFLPITDKKFRFELRFKANDPRKLGFEHSEILDGSNTVEVSHNGNYKSFPLIVFRGVAIGGGGVQARFEYEDGSTRLWWYDNQVPQEYTHTLDFYHGTYFISNTIQHLSVRRADNVFIPPGETVRVSLYPTNQGVIDGHIYWRDTWV